jgi:hypothetical protein
MVSRYELPACRPASLKLLRGEQAGEPYEVTNKAKNLLINAGFDAK